MTSLYVKTHPLPVPALLVMVALTAHCATGQRPMPPVASSSWQPTMDPAATLQAFVSAWNEADPGPLLSHYEPARRETIWRSPELERRRAAWRAVDQRVRVDCNPRGAYFKTAVVTYQDRRSGAQHEEIVWMHLRDGGWWMYSL